MFFLVQKYKNEELVNEEMIESVNLHELGSKYAVNSVVYSKTEFITKLTLKENAQTNVHISPDGVFFYFDVNGEEVVLDNLDFNWIKEPVGAYHSEILKYLDVETIVIIPKNNNQN